MAKILMKGNEAIAEAAIRAGCGTPELVLAGHLQVQEASRALGLPISMLIVSESLFKEANDQLVFELPILVIHRFWRHFL
jgi:hypothetical protein